jgi:hypothetical protein
VSDPGKEPVGVTTAKVIGAVLLVLVALGFGAMGACGVFFSGEGIWDAITWRGWRDDGGQMLIGTLSAVVGLGVAGLSVWAAVTLVRKRGSRDE